MNDVLGQLERPQADTFDRTRKLYLVPLVFLPREVPQELDALVDNYWQQTGDQLRNLQKKLGPVNRVYHEMAAEEGEGILTFLDHSGQKSASVVRSLCEQGAVLERTEDMDLLGENIDWGNCLSVIMTPKVYEFVSGHYRDTLAARWAQIAARIDKTLPTDGAGVLFVRSDHAIQFPPGIQVFYVSPPALDEIQRWLRERASRPGTGEEGKEENRPDA
ncbi:MAG: hypothetical protein M0Z41_07165 [Peptococcaceae bacterium]|jgi:hypothetical protein|nr:hypothetical protein [Peptococcaceae bacterium]